MAVETRRNKKLILKVNSRGRYYIPRESKDKRKTRGRNRNTLNRERNREILRRKRNMQRYSTIRNRTRLYNRTRYNNRRRYDTDRSSPSGLARYVRFNPDYKQFTIYDAKRNKINSSTIICKNHIFYPIYCEYVNSRARNENYRYYKFEDGTKTPYNNVYFYNRR